LFEKIYTFETASIHVCIHCFCSSFKSSHSFNCWKQTYAVWIKRREWSLLFNPLNQKKKNSFFYILKLFFRYADRRLLTDCSSPEAIVRCRASSSRKCYKIFKRKFSEIFNRIFYSNFTLHFNKTLCIWIDIFYRFISNLTCLKYIIKSDKFIEFCSSILDEHI
jgi:hypothetical protein